MPKEQKQQFDEDGNQLYIEIQPEGETRKLVFGQSGHSCGNAHKGIAFNIKGQAGGVITIDDALRLREWITKQLLEAVEEKDLDAVVKYKCTKCGFISKSKGGVSGHFGSVHKNVYGKSKRWTKVTNFDLLSE